MFGQLLVEQAQRTARKLKLDKEAAKSWGLGSRGEIDATMDVFLAELKNSVQMAESGQVDSEINLLYSRLRRAFVDGGLKLLGQEMRYAFLEKIVSARFVPPDSITQKRLADLSHPIEWYPATRAIHRTVHLHVGPTNSGKTYQALKRLETAKTGFYAGPLRLLAHEVYTRFNAKGKLCALVTGEERRIPKDMANQMSACTVEMVPLNVKIDVGVIDEIQMMGDPERGWAWTQAFLGAQAKELHLCGELRTIDIVTKLCKLMGDKLVIHKYERLSPLQMERRSLNGNLKNMQKGDAIILFSRIAIHAMKQDVERLTGRRCAVVYGGLPPETRAQQANLFNDPDNDYDFLVASDAVGMGLNLAIRRVIFESTSKHDGVSFRLMETSDIKQIAGRAGRFKTAHEAIKAGTSDLSSDALAVPPQLDLAPKKSEPNKGLVTTLEDFDMSIVKKAMTTDVAPLKAAGVFAPAPALLRFASYFPPETPFSYILLRLHNVASIGSDFFLCRFKEQIEIADIIQPLNLTNGDRITFMSAPVSLRDPGFPEIIKELANCVATQSGGELLDVKTMNLELLDMDINEDKAGSKSYLQAAETLHKKLTLYLWLSYRFAGVFRSQALAFHVKSLVEEKIDQCLSQVHFDAEKRRQLNYLRQKAAKEQLLESQMRAQSSDETSKSEVSVQAHASGEVSIGASGNELGDQEEHITRLGEIFDYETIPESSAERAEAEADTAEQIRSHFEEPSEEEVFTTYLDEDDRKQTEAALQVDPEWRTSSQSKIVFPAQNKMMNHPFPDLVGGEKKILEASKSQAAILEDSPVNDEGIATPAGINEVPAGKPEDKF